MGEIEESRVLEFPYRVRDELGGLPRMAGSRESMLAEIFQHIDAGEIEEDSWRKDAINKTPQELEEEIEAYHNSWDGWRYLGIGTFLSRRVPGSRVRAYRKELEDRENNQLALQVESGPKLLEPPTKNLLNRPDL
jgi:hypothetical protein